MIKVDGSMDGGIDRVEPVVNHDVVLTGDGTGFEIEDEGDMMSVFEAVAVNNSSQTVGAKRVDDSYF